MPTTATTTTTSKPSPRRRRRVMAVDPLMDRQAVADALCISYRSASRRLDESAATRSGLWPQLRDGNRVVVRASVVQAYMDALPCVEDVA